MARYITPAVTPLKNDGAIDEASCIRLYEHLIAGGVDGILILGSIGEFFAFTMDEKKALIRIACETVQKRVELIVGVTSMIFEEMTELSAYAFSQGADSVMIIPPYYFHFDDAQVEAYYDALAQAIPGPLYLYNFPDRTGYEISPQVVARLAEKHPSIIGIKDTISGMDHTREILRHVKPIRPDFRVFSGFDDNFLHNAASGGDGCIAGLSNIFPHLTSTFTQAVNHRDFAAAASCQQKINDLMALYAVGKPFVPFIKEALYQMGIINCPKATLPMPCPTDQQRKLLSDILRPFTKQ